MPGAPAERRGSRKSVTLDRISRVLEIADGLGQSRRPSGTNRARCQARNAEFSDPFSRNDFLGRLKTYLVRNTSCQRWMDAAAVGWSYEAESKLRCSLCSGLIVLSELLEESDSPDTPIAIKYKALLFSEHSQSCPWASKKCAPSAYGFPLMPPTKYFRQFKIRVDALVKAKLDEVKTNTSETVPEFLQEQFSETPLSALDIGLANWTLSGLEGSDDVAPSSDQLYLCCDYCCRRIGMWSLSKDEPFDPQKSHKWYCLWASAATRQQLIRRLSPSRKESTGYTPYLTASPVPDTTGPVPSATIVEMEEARHKSRESLRRVRRLIESTSAPIKRRLDADEEERQRWEVRRGEILSMNNQSVAATE